jgi:phosphoribosylanthranilate isomerase
MRTWIKFCGTTSVEDALASIEAGADALGFIFAASKRRVTAEQAREILRKVPDGVERIGVFMNQNTEGICRHVMDLNLTGVQLHGDESPAELGHALQREGRGALRIIKTILIRDDSAWRLPTPGESENDAVDAWLLDSGAGSGKTFDWQAARARLAGQQSRFIIAGGLTPDNVAEALRTFVPWGGDVVSGIEREPGGKDPEKMKAFVAAVRKAEQP